MVEDWKEVAKKIADDHVTWYLDSIKPLLIANLIHGFKHGIEWADGRAYVGEEDPWYIKERDNGD